MYIWIKFFHLIFFLIWNPTFDQVWMFDIMFEDQPKDDCLGQLEKPRTNYESLKNQGISS